MQLRSVVRGKFRQLTRANGDPVEATLHGCEVRRSPYAENGKTYAVVGLAEASGDVDALRKVDSFVRASAAPAYSPLSGDALTIKVPDRGVSWETEDGHAALDGAFALPAGHRVDVVLRLGAYGSFGYCWLVRRIKPAAP